MDYDSLRYLDLLEDYTSRETSRVRRNVGVLSIGVVLVQLLDVDLGALQIAGVPIVGDHDLLVTTIIAILLLYWSALFAFRFLADAGRRKERATIAEGAVGPVREQLKK
jgi:hypothetical protein